MKARPVLQDVLVDIGAIGAAETMTATQAQVGLRALNRMIGGWQAKRLLVFAVTEVVATLAGASATIGPGLQFSCPTPDGLNRGCYFVRSGMSYPLEVWDREAYNSVTLKAMAGEYPDGVYLDRAAGVVRFWPVPSGPAEFHLQVLARLPAFADLDTDYALPDGYEDAIHLSLCERLPKSFNLPVAPGVPQQAAAARRVIRTANADVPTLQIDSFTGGSGFRILTGNH